MSICGRLGIVKKRILKQNNITFFIIKCCEKCEKEEDIKYESIRRENS